MLVKLKNEDQKWEVNSKKEKFFEKKKQKREGKRVWIKGGKISVAYART